jgi:hypothetical protein
MTTPRESHYRLSDHLRNVTGQERFTAELLDRLWDRYRQRVPYVAAYEQLIASAGATFVNDHIAFRTIALQRPAVGIASVSRAFESLGYRVAGFYDFPDKHLSALHFRHSRREFPKLFISELRAWELSEPSRAIVAETLESHRPPLDDALLAALSRGEFADSQLIEQLTGYFHQLPWNPPERDAVIELNRESQYGAWVLMHGYGVNHFTALVNSHGKAALDDIEKTAAALRAAGVPMKAEIEGERGSRLRQTTTEAAIVDVPVRIDGRTGMMPWTYAYFEFAERGDVPDPETGRQMRFDGFLGPQATQLFEMTRLEQAASK